MLRGLTGSGVPVSGAQFIDIIKQRSPCILNNASGDMLAGLRSPARVKHWRAFAGRCHQKRGLIRGLQNDSRGTARRLPSCTFVLNRLPIDGFRSHTTAAPLKRVFAHRLRRGEVRFRSHTTAAPLKRRLEVNRIKDENLVSAVTRLRPH